MVPFGKVPEVEKVFAMRYRDRTERVTFQCPKLNGPAVLTFTNRESYADESPDPVITSLIKKDCSGRLYCGITPRTSPTSWGMSDWKACEYPNLKSKGVR
jgi:hypothetical protein